MGDWDLSEYHLLWKGVIRRALKDYAKGSESAEAYLRSPAFTEHLKMSGYPPELEDTVNELLEIGLAGRSAAVRSTLTSLKDF